jgi:uncharacterized damage-inducible protein DinB
MIALMQSPAAPAPVPQPAAGKVPDAARDAAREAARDATGRAAEALIAVLSQLASVVEALTDEQYTRKPVGVISSGVAGHVRHSLDHVDALLAGLADGEIDYDRRERGTPVEKIREIALGALRERMARLAVAPLPPPDRRLRLRTLLTECDPPVDLGTTAGREFAYALSHTIHHNALVSVIAKTMGVAVPDRLGYAPATLAYRKADPCAR